MTLQNRVLPTGEIVADPARGTLTGNRGILHDEDQRLGKARWRHPHWISCSLDYKGWQRKVMAPGTWTELFFLDEAVALAAGHRPCALCRRADYTALQTAWDRAFGAPAKAAEMDLILHAERIDKNTRLHRRHEAEIAALPVGTFILAENVPHLVVADRLLPYSPAGYGAPRQKQKAGLVTVLTPRPLVAILSAGYLPRLHPTAF